jgi:hypothetical protein
MRPARGEARQLLVRDEKEERKKKMWWRRAR